MSKSRLAILPFWTGVALAVALALSLSSVATAATKFWKNSAGSGNWSNGNNWSNVSAAGVDNGGAPGNNDVVNVSPTDGVARTITYDASSTPTHLEVDLTGAGAATTTFSMSANTLTASSEFIGFNGRGVFNHSGGTNNVGNFGGTNFLDVGVFAAAVGTYNLSGTGALVSVNSEYIGDLGTGFFNQTGGTNTISGAGRNLYLGFNGSASGTYTISAGSLTVNEGDIVVGNSGMGTLTIGGQASVYAANNLHINSLSSVNMNGGTLRFNTASGLDRLNFNSGTIQLAGDRAFGSDGTIATLFGANPTISTGKGLNIEGQAEIRSSVAVNGGVLTLQDLFTIAFNTNGTLAITNGGTLVSNGTTINAMNGVAGSVTVAGAGSNWTVNGNLFVRGATLQISGGGVVNTLASGIIGNSTVAQSVVVSGAGSVWNMGGNLDLGFGVSTLTVADQGLVHIGNDLSIGFDDTLNLNGGTIRLNELTEATGSVINFNAGTLQLAGDRSLGTDFTVQDFFATLVIPTGKGLTVEGAATLTTPLTIAGGAFKTNGLVIGSGGALDFDRGLLEITGGTITGLTSLAIRTNGEFRASGVQSLLITGEAGSTITATGNLTLGSAAAVNGFGTRGALQIGANTVTLLDANDVVFDSLSLVTLGSGASPGTLNAANGLTLDFGGNVTGVGIVSTPNVLAKPLINNGHITGTSAAQRITLPGYVKGVGTFDNVNFTGTFSPGLSPTILSVGNVALSPTSTLVMELGGTAPGSGYDQIQSLGALVFDGTLLLSLINGFSPAAGQSFNLFDWLSTSGTFDSLQLPVLAGLSWNTSQLYTTGVLSIAAAGLPGDYNQNGTVDAADYTVWRNHMVSGLPLPNDDSPGVNQDDYVRWKQNFGAPLGSGAILGGDGESLIVPEPSVCILAVSGVVGLLALRKKKWGCPATFATEHPQR